MASPARTALAITLVVLAAVIWPGIHLFVTDGYMLDLHVYFYGGHAVLHGHDLYAVRVRQYGFTYPPFAGLLFALPSVLLFDVLAMLVTVASLIGLVVVVRLSDKERTDRLWREGSFTAAAVIAVLIATEPIRMNLWLGQVNLVLTAMIMVDLLSTRPSRWRGVPLGIAAAIKLTPGVFVLYLLVRRRWREAGNAVAAFVAATGLAAVVLPSGSWKYWTDILWHGTGVGTSLDRHDNKSVLGVADRLFGSAGGPVWAVLVIPVAIAGLWVATLVSDTGREAYALGLVGVTGCLISPVSWPHHWIWLIPALAGGVHAAATRGWPTRIAVAVGALYFVPATQLGSATLQQNLVVRVIDENSYLVVAVALLAFAAAESRQASRAARSSRAEAEADHQRGLAAPA